MARQLTEARDYEISLAQAYVANQASLRAQALTQACLLSRMNQNPGPQSSFTPFASTAWLGFPAYTSGPVFMNFNLGAAPESNYGSHAHAAFHVETAMHHGHGH